MAITNISKTSFTMSDEFNLSASKISMKGQIGERLPDLSDYPVFLPIQLSSFVSGLLGALPVVANPNSRALSPIEKGTLAAVAVAGRIVVTLGGEGFSVDYLPSLLKVTNGSYQRNGILSGKELENVVLSFMTRMIAASGSARNMYSQLLKQALESAVILAALKGGQKNCSYSGDPVNANTGNFIYEKEDLHVKGHVPLIFKRFYNRIDTRTGSMGKGWHHNYEIQLIKEEDRYVILWEDGREEVYFRNEDGTPEPLFGGICRLQAVSGKYQYTAQDKTVYLFGPEGKLLKTENRNGMGISLTYDKQGRLSRVTNSAGSSLAYQYDEFSGWLKQVTDHTGRDIKLAYALGCLKEVTAATGDRHTYLYDEDNNLYRIRNPRRFFALENSYDQSGRTVKQVFADGGQITYEYQEESARTLMSERNGSKIAYVHDERFRNVRTVYLDGEETFTYNDRNQLVSKTDKRGNQTRYSYDDRGNTAQIIYPDGEKHNMTYDADNRLLVLSVNGHEKKKNYYDAKGNLIKVSDAMGQCREMEYDDHGNVVRVRQPDGGNTALQYDKRGNIIRIVDVSGNCTAYEYDDCNRAIRTIDGNGHQTKFSYDACNRIVGVRNAEGKCRCYEYAPNGKVSRFTDYNGAVTIWKYNPMNEAESCTLPDGGTILMEYDSMQNVTRRILPNGAEITYDYDSLSRLEKMTLPTGGELHYEYDANGNRTACTDPYGNRTSYEYDERNRLVRVIDAAGAAKEYEYNLDGYLTGITDAKGKTHTCLYDENGQLSREIDILGNTTCYEYNALGKLSCMTDMKKRKTVYEYKPGGTLSKIIYPDGSFETFSYDKNGNIVCRQNQRGDCLEFGFDCMNRMTSMRSTFGQEVRYTYNEVGKVTSVTDAMKNTTRYEYSPGGRLVSVLDALGNRTEYAYDSMGGLTAICRHEGGGKMLKMDGGIEEPAPYDELHITRYERNLLGKVAAITNPLGVQEQYEYDLLGRVTLKRDGDGTETAYSYSATGDIEQITYSDGRSVAYTYNALRQLTQVHDWLGVTRIDVDGMGRPEKITDYMGREIAYQWNSVGEQKALVYPDGRMVCYEYDELSRLIKLMDGTREILYHYDEAGRLSEKICPGDIVSRYEYNPAGFLKSLVHQDMHGILEQYEYEYDLLGNKTAVWKQRNTHGIAAVSQEGTGQEIQEENGYYRYLYDGLNRLTEVKKGREVLRQYGYDAFGNRIWKKSNQGFERYSYNAASQLIRTEGVMPEESYHYDRRGNLTAICQGNTIIRQYRYDAANRLSAAANAHNQVVRYQYDGLGNRVKMQEYALPKDTGDLGSFGISEQALMENPAKEADYLLDLTRQYHNLLSLTEEGGETAVRQSYVWDSNAAFMTEGESAHIYLQDELGSPVRLVDMHTRNQTVYGYDEFGQDLYGTQGIAQPFGYTGYRKDDIADTYFAQAREYLPNVGRFGGEDLVKGRLMDPATWNPYGYCGSNPLVWVDADGKRRIRSNAPSYEEIWAGYWKQAYESADRAWRQLWEDAFHWYDDTVDITVQFGTGLGAKGSINSINVGGVLKNYIEIDENLEMTFKGEAGVSAGKEDILDFGYLKEIDYLTGEQKTKVIGMDSVLWDGSLKITFGGEIYAGIGGGGYISIDLVKIGEAFYESGKALIGCDSQL